MIAAKIACPHCRSVLGISSVMTAGQSIQCPKCGKAFTLSESVGQAPAAKPNGTPARKAPPKAARPSQPAPALEDGADEEPDFSTLAGHIRKPSKGSKAGLVVVCLLSAGLIAMGLSLLFVDWGSFFGSSKKEDDKFKGGPVDQAPDEKQTAKKTGGDGNEAPDDKEPVKNPKDNTAKGPPKEGPEGFNVPLPREQQEKVNKAVEAGVKYLKSAQESSGKWSFTGPANDRFQVNTRNQVGMAALPGLTLLECGVPKDDPVIQKAAAFVRKNYATLDQTYDISLAILFLDRLGEPADKTIIQTLAMRLAAGQKDNGGWYYTCPVLPPGDESQLLAALRNMPAPGTLDLVKTPTKPDAHNKLTLPEDFDPSGDRPSHTKLILDTPEPSKDKLEAFGKLPPYLQKVPALQTKPGPNTEGQKSDNSNTQFAALALWVARDKKYDLPLDRTLGLVVKRFRTSQFYTGAWDYGYVYTVGTPSKEQAKLRWVGRDTMTCAGLLGLALGRSMSGLDLKGSHKDDAVDKALKALARALAIHKTKYAKPKSKEFNFYFLWSVERVGMIYEIRYLGKVDWYVWGSDFLAGRQNKDGSWFGNGYHGSNQTIDTSLALLFLKRVNLAKGLQSKLVLDLGD